MAEVDFNVETIEPVIVHGPDAITQRDLMSPYVWKGPNGHDYRMMVRAVPRMGETGDLMRTYYQTHQPRLRRLMAQLLQELEIPHRLVVEAPPSVEVALRRKGETLLVHFVNRAVNPCLTPRLHMVEEVPPSKPVALRLQCRKPASVRLQPGDREVAWRYGDGMLACRIESIAIHDILEIK